MLVERIGILYLLTSSSNIFIFPGEALGAIGSDSVMDILKEYEHSPVQEVCNSEVM